jgi:hypothetical protein
VLVLALRLYHLIQQVGESHQKFREQELRIKQLEHELEERERRIQPATMKDMDDEIARRRETIREFISRSDAKWTESEEIYRAVRRVVSLAQILVGIGLVLLLLRYWFH